MKSFIVIETADVEILGVTPYRTLERATEAFETLARANGATEIAAEDLIHEAPGTLRLAGDVAYAVQLFERDIK